MDHRDFLDEHFQLTRRFFLQAGLAGIATGQIAASSQGQEKDADDGRSQDEQVSRAHTGTAVGGSRPGRQRRPGRCKFRTAPLSDPDRWDWGGRPVTPAR